MRAHAAGIPFFYTKSGAGTIYADGSLITKYNKDGTPERFIPSKFKEVVNGQEYLKEGSRSGDFALVKAWKGDQYGNLIFRETARNFNPVACRAAKTSIVEVEEIVPTGAIDPDAVHLSGIYVDYLVLGGVYEKRIMHQTISHSEMVDESDMTLDKNSALYKREKIARRAAKEFKEGQYVNLGIGIPEHASNFIPKNMTVHIDSENGVLGLGPFPLKEEVDADLINAGKETVTVYVGASYFSSEESFAMIRG